jgi:hypothetical protein
MLGLLMKTLPTLIAALLLGCAAAHAGAEPAPWHQWRSKVDGKLVCTQAPLGPGWEIASGPYQDSHCEKRMKAK